MSSQKSEMSDRGFLFLTIALGAGVIWLKYKAQIVTFIVTWRIAISFAISLLAVFVFQMIRKKLRNIVTGKQIGRASCRERV